MLCVLPAGFFFFGMIFSLRAAAPQGYRRACNKSLYMNFAMFYKGSLLVLLG